MFNLIEIAHADCIKLLSKTISLCDKAAIYVVDKDQKVLHWGQKMEEITGIRSNIVVGKHCIEELLITYTVDNKASLLTLLDGNNESIQVTVERNVFFNSDGTFAGGIGYLQLNKNDTEKRAIDKILHGSQRVFHGMLSRSPAMQPVFQLIENAANTDVTVLVRGESGSGKELVAQAIHDLSGRKIEPLLAINCAALSSNLLESELFGHVRGAFTGAIKDHKGLFHRANGGTLFLDEVAELPLDLQAKLLRVVQERSFIPVGGDQSFSVDVRIVAATHRSLREEVKKGRFREDLMYRLRVVPIFIPPLRDRREDINLLLWHFIKQHNDENLRCIDSVDPQAMRVLMDYHWPGNIRELQNVVEYAFVVGQGNGLYLSDLPPEFREPLSVAIAKPSQQLLTVEEEADAISQALIKTEGKVSSAAELLGMSRATFWRKRKLYRL